LNLIFITYVNRSGSTYLANIFSKYDEVLVCPEADILINKFLINPSKSFKFNDLEKNRIKKIVDQDNKLKLWNISFNNLLTLEYSKINFDSFR